MADLPAGPRAGTARAGTAGATGFGPEGRPGAVAVTVDVGDPPPPPGVLAVLLDHLDRRATATTWFLAARTDPALVDRLFFWRHEVGALVATVGDLGTAAAALRAREVPVVGARVVGGPATRAQVVEAGRDAGLAYVLVDGDRDGRTGVDDAGVPDGDRPDGPVVAVSAPAPATLAVDPHAWLRATQVAVGRAIEARVLLEVRVDPTALDRPPAVGVVAEAVDLVAGLARAGRLHVGPLRELVPARPSS